MPTDRDIPAQHGLQTRAVHADRALDETRAVSPPIWQTTSFRAPTSQMFAELATATAPAEFYTRYGNPTLKQVEATIASLEGGEAALVVASGMGAMFAATMSLLRSGDHVVLQDNHYAGTAALFRDVASRWGIGSTAVANSEPSAFEAAIRPETKLLVLETPTNPLLRITDLRAVAAIARARGVTTIADNTFATPVNQRPIELGIDLVVHSATKYLGGHHDVVAGAIVGRRDLVEKAWAFSLVAGAVLGPFDGWLLLRGLRTLGLRVERHNANALAIARRLAEHPRVQRVHYPGLASHPQHDLARAQMSGFGGVVSVEIVGGYAAAERFIDRLELGARAASLGGFETLVVHPASMWAKQLPPEERRAAGIDDGLVRISVGLEDERDLLADMERALA